MNRNFSDTKQRGALDINDFSLGMYLIQTLLTGKMEMLPSTLPNHVHQLVFAPQSTPQSPSIQEKRSPLNLLPSSTPSSSTSPHLKTPEITAAQTLPKQTSPNPPDLTNGPVSPSQLAERLRSSSLSTIQGSELWEISQRERRESDIAFASLDHQRLGYVEGDDLAKYMLTFKLPPEDLALIWYFSDSSLLFDWIADDQLY
jgi:epidermal growth factor receptor substrate 15